MRVISVIFELRMHTSAAILSTIFGILYEWH